MKLILLDRNSKIPPRGKPWKIGISEDPELHARWLAEGFNVGFPLEENGCSAVDFDDKESARVFWKEHPEVCSYATETQRGIHLLFKGSTSTRKFPKGDIKGNGYLTWPPSIVEGWTYRFIRQGELKDFPEELFPEREVKQISRKVKSALHYVMQVESFQGKYGSWGLVRACSILRDGGYSQAEAMAVLVRWNQNPQKVWPPWSLEELAKAVDNTYQKGRTSA